MEYIIGLYLAVPFLYRALCLRYKVQIVPVYIKDSLKEDGWFIIYGYIMVVKGGYDFEKQRMIKPKFGIFTTTTPDIWKGYSLLKKLKIHTVTQTLLFIKLLFTPHIKLFKFIEDGKF